MKVLVIIVSYNFEQWMKRCLESLRHSEMPIDVLVLDNDSKDNTIELIRTHYPEVRLIENRKNLGFGQANNLGMQIALEEGYDFVFLMNPDAWIDSNTIDTLVTLSQKHPKYGILSPVHLTGKGDKPDPGFGDYANIRELKELPNTDEILPLPFINAAFWMIPIAVLKQVGGFSPLFYHYGEDKDFVNRLHFHHFQVGYAPKLFGNHDREYRPVTHSGFLRSEYVYHLSEYANINYSDWKAFAHSILAVGKKSVQALLQGKLGLSKDYLCMIFRLTAKSQEVFAQRKKSRLSHPHYILS